MLKKVSGSLFIIHFVIFNLLVLIAPSNVFAATAYSLSLNGTTAYAQASHNAELNLTNDWTVEAWVKDTNTAGNYNHPTTYIINKGDTNTQGESPYLMGIEWNNLFVGERTGWSNRVLAYNLTTGGISFNAWHHIAATFKGSTRQVTIYIDGVQKAQGTIPAKTASGNSTAVSIGRNGTTGHNFKGLLDDVRIWNVVRTPSEIAANDQAELSSGPASLVANWRFNEGAGTSAADNSTPAQNATLTNATWSTDVGNNAAPPDITPPTVSISAPTDGSTVSGNAVTVSANASDDVGVAGVQFKLDGVNLGAEDITSPYSVSWNTTTATNGNHNLTAVARDAATNTTTSTVVVVNVNNPPTLTITSPTEGQTISGTTVNVIYTKAGDLTGADHAHLYLDSNPRIRDLDFDGLYTFLDVPSGNHTLTALIARADHTEIAGSDDTVSFVTTTPDTTPPTVSITSPAQDATVSGTLAVSANASDDVGVVGVQFKLDGNNLGAEDTTSPYSVSWDTRTTSDGPHTLTAVARDASANSTTATANVNVLNGGQAGQVGQWSAIKNWPLVAVHGSLLNTGKVLVWDAWELGTTNAKIWDPVTEAFTPAPVADQLFCAGHSMMSDGKILTTGGHDGGAIGTPRTFTFNPSTSTWTRTADMSSQRWYPSNTTLGDGRVVTISGQKTPLVWADTPEIYNPATNTWTNLSVSTGDMHDQEYPLAFLLPTGKLAVLGADDAITRLLDVSAQTWTAASALPLKFGSAAEYRPGKLLYTGGGVFLNSGSSNQAAVIDFNQPTPSWRTVAPMAYTRYDHNLTVLPDGKVLAVGGSDRTDQETITGPLAVELFDPNTETWTTMASMSEVRQYHSISMVLPDGRVLVAGGGRINAAVDHFTAQVYSPSYLFKGARPTITTAPDNADYGTNITVDTPDAAGIQTVSLLPLASVTHTLDMNQKYVELNFTKGTNQLTVTTPTNGNVAPPGYYMMFILNSNGVPSISKIIKMNGAGGDNQAPTAPSNLTANGGAGSVSLAWTASTDNVGVVNYNVHRSTTAGFTPSAGNRVGQPTTNSFNDTGLAAGTYYYKVTAQDAASNVSAASSEASGVVTGDTTPPTVNSTTPTAGATNVAVDSNVTVIFSEAMDATTINTNTVLLKDPANATVPAAVSYNSGTNTATLDPTASLSLSTTYTVVVEGGATDPRAKDVAGNALVSDLTSAFTTTSTPPPAGFSVNFNGTSAYAQAPNDAELNLTGNWTVETWFKDTNTAGNYNHAESYLLMKGDTNIEGEAPYYMMIGWNNLHVGVRNGWSSSSVIYNLSEGEISFNAWHHAAATFDAATRTITLYVDGVQKAQGTVPAVSSGNSNDLSIGRNGTTGQHFKGLLDDVRVWNTIRTASEITANYQSEISSGTGLVGHWRFNEGTGTNAADSAGTAQNAALTNATWSTETH